MTPSVASIQARLNRDGSGPAELLTGSSVAADIEVGSITNDSRQVGQGGLFACVSGEFHDGHQYARQAVTDGAVALLVERQLNLGDEGAEVPQIVVPDVRAALGSASCEVYGDPSLELSMVGITGTSGKTTVAQMLGEVLSFADKESGGKCAVLGTLSGTRTTPEAPALQAQLRQLVNGGYRHVAMEVSSHALSLGRVSGTHFDVAVFTNFGHDHLDFHETEQNYLAAKAALFSPVFADLAVINAADSGGQAILRDIAIEVIPYQLSDVTDLSFSGASSRFRWRSHEIVLHMAGTHNVMNALAVAVTAEALGLAPDLIADGLCRVEPPRGRFEFVNIGQVFHVVVDYAHKPDALAAVLAAARQVAAENRVLVVFGCGGDRDTEKRPLMGAVAASRADQVIITSDNPRSEDPDTIMAEILSGAVTAAGASEVIMEPDRRRAIAKAIALARDGDVVLLAGKGHETVQELGDTVIEFDDRQVALEVLSEVVQSEREDAP